MAVTAAALRSDRRRGSRTAPAERRTAVALAAEMQATPVTTRARLRPSVVVSDHCDVAFVVPCSKRSARCERIELVRDALKDCG